MARRYFGTDGIRGVYGGPVMNDDFAARIAFAGATWARQSADGSRAAPRVLIGRDTRRSGEPLLAAVASGVRAAGLEPVSLGVLPTPAVSRAVRDEDAALGIVITASHNPAADNGIKFFRHGGLKLTDAEELRLEALLPAELPAAAAGARAARVVEDGGRALRAYVAMAEQVLPANALRGWRIVVDTANGATCASTPQVLRALGAELVALGDAPDGTNINAGVGSEHPALLAAKVRESGARLGLAHDGDGDRCVLCDEHGGVLDGDEILTLLATHALARGRLAQRTLVVTMQANLGVDAAVIAAGGRVVRTNVGDRYVIERMRAEGATLGGETSGHIVCSDLSPTGDGLVAALRVLEAMLATGKPLSQLRQALVKFPQMNLALKVREKTPLEQMPRVTGEVQKLENELGAKGRVLVRYSGTEPKLRLLVEGPTQEIVGAALARLEAVVRAEGILA